MNKRVLILVGGSRFAPYDLFEKVQKETWGSIRHPNIDILYFFSGGENKWVSEDTYGVDCPVDFYAQHLKMKGILNEVWDRKWDIIFRVHSSSYVDQHLLWEKVKELPTEKLYGGWVLGEGYPDVEWEGKLIPQQSISGAGVFLSRDTADILRKQLPEGQSIEEDVLMGRILHINGCGITWPNKERVDISNEWSLIRDSYHYRIKTSNRMHDLQTMIKVHEVKLEDREFKLQTWLKNNTKK